MTKLAPGGRGSAKNAVRDCGATGSVRF
jgi:hypothetical protein